MNALELARKNIGTAHKRQLLDTFMADFEVVAAHYAMNADERSIALEAARNDRANAATCYGAIARSLMPVGRSKYGNVEVKLR